MRLHHLVNQVWLRLVKLFHKPTFVFVVETWSAEFSNRGGDKMSTAIFLPLSNVSTAFIAYQF